ncbi:hypothetical protein GGI35DRAFT_338653 [Trichoderma velutinum]
MFAAAFCLRYFIKAVFAFFSSISFSYSSNVLHPSISYIIHWKIKIKTIQPGTRSLAFKSLPPISYLSSANQHA